MLKMLRNYSITNCKNPNSIQPQTKHLLFKNSTYHYLKD